MRLGRLMCGRACPSQDSGIYPLTSWERVRVRVRAWVRLANSLTPSLSQRESVKLPASPNLNRVVEKLPTHVFEPMGRVVRHNNYIALLQLPCLAPPDAKAANFIRRNLPGFGSYTASDKPRVSLHDVNDVGIERVDLSLAGFVAAAGVDHVIPVGSIEQHRTL